LVGSLLGFLIYNSVYDSSTVKRQTNLDSTTIKESLSLFNAIQAFFDILYRAVKMFKSNPGIPDGLWPIKLFVANICKQSSCVVVLVLLAIL
jgi:hypothetical protein